MRYFLVLILFVPSIANSQGKYEKRKAGEPVSFDAMCLDLEAVATLAAEQERVKQQCLLDAEKSASEYKVQTEALVKLHAAEIDKKNAIISMLTKAPTSPKKDSVWRYVATGAVGVAIGVVGTVIVYSVVKK